MAQSIGPLRPWDVLANFWNPVQELNLPSSVRSAEAESVGPGIDLDIVTGF